jgi:two-component system cell cycle sensor histidine kinase/response regulator CckA
MKLDLLTLKFSGNSSKLEAPFLSDYYWASLPHIRISLILGTLFYAAFGFLDALLMPEQKSTLWFIRYVIVCPVLFGTLLASYLKSFERYFQPLLAGDLILGGGGIIFMIIIAPPPVNYSYYAGLLLVFMWGYTFIRVRFLWASLAGWVQVMLYEIAAIWISPMPFSVLLSNNFFFISANVIGMLACYSIEFYARRDFFLTQQLEIERETVNKINQDLEERVEKRTVDYRTVNRALEQEITERKRMEEALRESEKRYRLIAENTADLISILNMNLRFTYVSPASMRLRGFTVEESMEQTLDQVLAPESMRLGLTVFEKEMQLEASGTADSDRTRILELEEYKKDGSTIWVEVSLSFLRDKDGKPVEILIVSRDITDRKRAQEEKRSLTERLQRAEKMEALGTMAGGVAHDLNNVLGIVVGYAEMLLMDIDISSSMRPSLVNIMSGGQRAAAIVQDLLTLARRGVSGREVLNLNKIIADSQQSPEFEKLSTYHPSVSIRIDLEPDLLNISGSSLHLAKSLYNLVSNACEAMAKGGNLTIKTANQYLDKPIHGYDDVREGDYVVLSISDTGEGIHEADLKRIFEPFYTKKVMGRSGTGLGLAVVWGTMMDHSGYINVQSEEGKGSTFTLYFPVIREEITTEAVAISVSEYMGNGESILVVDDVEGQRDLAVGMLRKLNYNALSVSSGEEAIAYLKDHQADLVVLDMIMDPGMDGLDTYKSILMIHPKQKVIIVSGFSESDRVKTTQSLGAGGYVRKPYVIEKLGLAVRKELDRK